MIYGSYVSVHEAVNVCMHLLMTVLCVLADRRGGLLITAPWYGMMKMMRMMRMMRMMLMMMMMMMMMMS